MNKARISQSLAIILMAASGPALASGKEIRSYELSKLSRGARRGLLEARVLIQTSSQCFRLDFVQAEKILSAEQDPELFQFISDLAELTNGQSDVTICRASDMKLASQDGGGLR